MRLCAFPAVVWLSLPPFLASGGRHETTDSRATVGSELAWAPFLDAAKVSQCSSYSSHLQYIYEQHPPGH